MQIQTASWHLKLQCPCCGQGQPLLVACRRCAHLAAECEEVGTFFADISASLRCSPSEQRCVRCGAEGRDAFVVASSFQIQSAGLEAGQYE